MSRGDAARLARGQAVLLRGRDAPIMEGWVAVSTQGALIALAEVEKGELRPAAHLQPRPASRRRAAVGRRIGEIRLFVAS